MALIPGLNTGLRKHETASGFTLIELLIVVAIISILASIAVPNFLEAQIRAKVSRVKADMATLCTATEMYAVDNNVYPPVGDDLTPTAYLTGPIKYLSSYPNTPFEGVPVKGNKAKPRYFYINVVLGLNPDSDSYLKPEYHEMLIRLLQRSIVYFYYSYGPEGSKGVKYLVDDEGNILAIFEYNPTRGSVSMGIISMGNDRQAVGE